MKIGTLTLETVEPNEVRLLSSTGLSVAEMRRSIAGAAPSLVARALNACLVEPVGVSLLAREIAADPKARVAIGALYGLKERKRGKKS